MVSCKAWVCLGPNEIALKDVDVDDNLREDEVLLRIDYSSVCHTDLYTMTGLDPEGKFPCILGHEAVGTVVKSHSAEFSVGDVCIPLYIPECRRCRYCLSSHGTNLCQAVRETQGQGFMPDGTSRITLADTKEMVYHFMGISAFSQYSVVLGISLVKLEDSVPKRLAPLLGCGVTTGVGAVRNVAQVSKGSSVAVFGLGCVGIAAMLEADRCGAKQIIGIEKDPKKIEFVKSTFSMACRDVHFLEVSPEKCGGSAASTAPASPETKSSPCTTTSDAEIACELANRVKQLTSHKEGVDYSFDATGNVTIMRAALECCHKGWGVCTVIGVASAGAEISTRPFQFITGRKLQGCAFGGVKGKSELPALMVELAGEGDITAAEGDHSPMSENAHPASMDAPVIPHGREESAHHHHSHYHDHSTLKFPLDKFVTSEAPFEDLAKVIHNIKTGTCALRTLVKYDAA